MTNITLIGAGSVEFTQILLADLSDFPELAGTTIALHDIDAERLDTAERLARYVTKETGAGFQIRAELDRRAALDGADFVVNEIQVGGFDATLRDFDMPGRYGLRQTIGDTIGVGGVFRGLRTIPVLVAIANDMAELCPEAMLLNYANPMAMLPVGRLGGQPAAHVIGLCHSVQNTHEQLAEIVGVPGAGDRLRHRRPQPSGVRAAVRARRRGPLPAARRGDRARPRGPGPARAGRAVPAVRLLPHRVQRAQRRVRAVVHAPRRPARALPDPGRRVPPPLARRTSTSTRIIRRRSHAGEAMPESSARASSRRGTSTRWSPASPGSSTATSATTA